MLSNISERKIHRVRWVLAIGWLQLIFSLFRDPLTPWLTNPRNWAYSPFNLELNSCVMMHGECMSENYYPIGAAVFWSIVVPSSIFILFVFGHEFWRRICPLAFFSQIPRALGWQRKRNQINARTGKQRKVVISLDQNSWLAKNHLLVQLGLFYVGLCLRLLFVNSNRTALGVFLLSTIVASIFVGYLFDGKPWCQYICPMAPVQKIFGEPRGLFNSQAHVQEVKQAVTQSMCRTVDENGQDKPACVGCQKNCIDIDAERSYWDSITHPNVRWLYYGYFGLTIGFFVYYYLYSGGWSYYFSGAWNRDNQTLDSLLGTGFYIAGQAISIPKLVAVPLTLGLSGVASYYIGTRIEKQLYAIYARLGNKLTRVMIRHRMFTLSTFLIFNVIFFFSRESISSTSLFSLFCRDIFSLFFTMISVLWLYRTWKRTPKLYQRELLAVRLRKQLRKFDINIKEVLGDVSLGSLSTDEVYVLAKTLKFSHLRWHQIYQDVLLEAIRDGSVTPANSLGYFQMMREELNVSHQEHEDLLIQLGHKYPEVFYPKKYLDIDLSALLRFTALRN